MSTCAADRQRCYNPTHMQEEGYNHIANPAARAKERLSAYEVDPKKFKGIYPADEIERDMRKVAELEERFGQSPIKKYGDLFEAVVCEHGELSDWFGPNAQVIKTYRYDDFINKIDLVVETSDAEGEFTQLALGVDVTFGSQDLTKKFTAIRDNIDTGELGHVKYFLADRPGDQKFAGSLHNIPHVVAGMEVDRVTELGLMWMDPKKKKELSVHPIQMIILEEAALQLEAFRDYAAAGTGEKTRALAPILDQKLQDVKKLLREKRAAGIKTIEHDAVFEEIKRNLQLFSVPGAAKT